MLIAAYVLFAIGTALSYVMTYIGLMKKKKMLTPQYSGLGRNLWEVVAARAVCGMGGAGMQVIVSILIAGIYFVWIR